MLTAKCRSKPSAVVSGVLVNAWMPASSTRTSTSPAWAARARTSSASARSAVTHRVLPPRSPTSSTSRAPRSGSRPWANHRSRAA
ncbi:MAG TPA: hypothetical protein VFZ92_04055 [Umezawaea sp.]